VAIGKRLFRSDNPRTRAFFQALLVITAVALLIRIGVAVALFRTRSVQDPLNVTDMATYVRLASGIVSGTWPEFFYYQPLYYAVFLPLIYLVFGVRAFGVVAVQVLLSTATVALCGLCAARLFGRRAGLIAAGLLALAAMPVFYVSFHLIATLQAFWMALLLASAISCWWRDGFWRWSCLGLVLSAAILTRGNALLLLPGVLVLGAWRHRRTPKRAALVAALLVALVYVPQLPFALRNASHYGRWTGPSSAQDAVLALGNTPEAPAGGLEYPPSYQAWVNRASRSGGDRVPVSRQILHWALESPMAFIELKFRAMLLFWHRMEIPNNVSIDREGRASVLLSRPFLLPFAVIGSLGLFGLFVLWKTRSPLRLFLYYAVVTYWLGTALFYILARFRVPVVPLVCVCAGGGVSRLILVCRSGLAYERKRQRLLLMLLAAAAALFVVLDGFTFYQRSVEPAAMRLVRPHGVAVDLGDRFILHDHGPFGVGGLRFFSLPAGGLTIEKRFAPPAAPPAWLSEATAVFRLPAQLSPGARLAFELTVGDRTFGADDLEIVTEQGMQWLQVTVGELRPAEAAGPFTVRLMSMHGDVYVGFDTLREYQRTRVLDSKGGELPLPAEAAAEIVWVRSQKD
jgi:4-amino-4-deoxy-L-arabinose transferase-like glycosyltransferase